MPKTVHFLEEQTIGRSKLRVGTRIVGCLPRCMNAMNLHRIGIGEVKIPSKCSILQCLESIASITGPTFLKLTRGNERRVTIFFSFLFSCVR